MISLQFCKKESLERFHWPAEALPFKQVLGELVTQRSQDFVSNCKTDFQLCRIDEFVLPITINDTEYSNSYVCSPYAGAVSYPLFELREINSWPLRIALAAIICSASPMLRLAQIDQAVCVNNWMLSTNLYPNWIGEGLTELTAELTRQHPRRAILLRSINEYTNPRLCQRLRQEGYLLAPSRQVWIYDPADQYLKRKNCRWDLRLLDEETPYRHVSHEQFSRDDDSRIKQLYDMLYVEKYSPLNPQFTTELVRSWRESNVLRLFGLRSESGSLDAVAGCFERGNVLTTPLVGYDTSLPMETGLYRMLVAGVLRDAHQRGQILNFSSGAAEFKRIRGAKPFLEYTAIYCNHLSRFRRTVWQALTSLLVNVGAPVLRKLEL